MASAQEFAVYLSYRPMLCIRHKRLQPKSSILHLPAGGCAVNLGVYVETTMDPEPDLLHLTPYLQGNTRM